MQRAKKLTAAFCLILLEIGYFELFFCRAFCPLAIKKKGLSIVGFDQVEEFLEIEMKFTGAKKWKSSPQRIPSRRRCESFKFCDRVSTSFSLEEIC